MAFLTAGFAGVFPEKQLELKSLKGQTKAEELGTPLKDALACSSWSGMSWKYFVTKNYQISIMD
jgi:hypothetical protein